MITGNGNTFKDNTAIEPAQIINTTNNNLNKIVFPYDLYNFIKIKLKINLKN